LAAAAAAAAASAAAPRLLPRRRLASSSSLRVDYEITGLSTETEASTVSSSIASIDWEEQFVPTLSTAFTAVGAMSPTGLGAAQSMAMRPTARSYTTWVETAIPAGAEGSGGSGGSGGGGGRGGGRGANDDDGSALVISGAGRCGRTWVVALLGLTLSSAVWLT
jgi:hypothetical protein